MLSHLIYISYRNENCTDEEIQNILKSCKKNNGHNDITGVLLYSDKQFVQYLEGEYNEIISLFEKIKKDKRHRNVIMLTSFPIKERAFPSWQMGAKKVSLEDVEFVTNVSSEHEKAIRNVLSGKIENKAIPVIDKLFK